MNATKHTPGPWQANGRTVLDSEGRSIADCKIVGRDDEERAANALFIATARNSHYALKNTVKHLLEWINAEQKPGYYILQLEAEAREALANVTTD